MQTDNKLGEFHTERVFELLQSTTHVEAAYDTLMPRAQTAVAAWRNRPLRDGDCRFRKWAHARDCEWCSLMVKRH